MKCKFKYFKVKKVVNTKQIIKPRQVGVGVFNNNISKYNNNQKRYFSLSTKNNDNYLVRTVNSKQKK